MTYTRSLRWFVAAGVSVVALLTAIFGLRVGEAAAVAWLICLPLMLIGQRRVADSADVSIISMKRGLNYAMAGMPLRLAWALVLGVGAYKWFDEHWGVGYWLCLVAFYQTALLLIVARTVPGPRGGDSRNDSG